MYIITLLSSFHKSLGKCNPTELYKIIETIQPEIIFEELSYTGLDVIYSSSYQPQTVEAITIKKYLQKHSIKHFSVDTYPIVKGDLFRGADQIAKRNLRYVELWKKQVSMIKEKGYEFLNSDTCVELLDEIHALGKAVLLEMNNEKLSLKFHFENNLHRKREDEMLKNIYNISRQYPYNNAMFICGAEHRKPLMQKIQGYNAKGNLMLRWKFY